MLPQDPRYYQFAQPYAAYTPQPPHVPYAHMAAPFLNQEQFTTSYAQPAFVPTYGNNDFAYAMMQRGI